MAKENENKAEKQEEKESPQEDKNEQKQSSGRMVPLIIMAVAAIVCIGVGFVVGRVFAGMRGTKPAETAKNPGEPEPAAPKDLSSATAPEDSKELWYYDLEPVVANLNVPGVTRYVRATLTLAIGNQLDQKKGAAFLREKKPLLTNWLTIYLASLTLDDIRGDNNLRRIQMQILDAFNEKLFPDSSGQIKKILFKEFAVQ